MRGFCDHLDNFTTAGVAHVFGLSTQSSAYQREVVKHLHLPFSLLSDKELELKQALDLPYFEAAGMTLLHRLILSVVDGKTANAFENKRLRWTGP